MIGKVRFFLSLLNKDVPTVSDLQAIGVNLNTKVLQKILKLQKMGYMHFININAFRQDGDTIFMHCLRKRGRLPIAKKLLRTDGIDLNLRNRNQELPVDIIKSLYWDNGEVEEIADMINTMRQYGAYNADILFVSAANNDVVVS